MIEIKNTMLVNHKLTQPECTMTATELDALNEICDAYCKGDEAIVKAHGKYFFIQLASEDMMAYLRSTRFIEGTSTFGYGYFRGDFIVYGSNRHIFMDVQLEDKLISILDKMMRERNVSKKIH